MGSRKRITAALVGLVVLVLVGWLVRELGSGTAAPGPAPVSGTAVPGAASGLSVRPLSELPAEAAATWRLIQRGGPFPYPRNDGTTFQNREKLLPAKSSGYYREYTVPTPGSPDRGARRLISGSEKELYYTADHYGSFVVVDATR
ncbi:Guanyl-specific ribonuclease Sa [Alloactinosynnema sp. L-07]|uniref:ribonuclease domain-containing protein n=1 Tax=Alloactinosynnema sp. L-07 TaxID=1653480 RepID=UPI00065EF948|nr:ribonuclease domain-containing protein [Alloactinosynnema sp. L-07]CRK55523.1 Guanyl-specific ribonuclease Sa [Alloactinosynnema sp. L-07]